jgi:hypothetical protein
LHAEILIQFSVSGKIAAVPDLDLTDIGLYRDGFPHDVFTELRRKDPVRWQAFPEGFADGPPTYRARSHDNPVLTAVNALPARLS